MNTNKIWTRDFILSCLGCFFLFVNFYMLLSSMPLAIKQHMGGTARDMSLVVSIYLLGIVLLRPFSGVISDRIGSKKVSILTMFLFVICSFMYLGIHAIVPLLIVRMIHGVFHSLSTTAHAAMAITMVPNSRKGEGVGYYGLAMSLSMVLGPALGLYILNSFGFEVLIFVAAIFSVISWLLTLFIKNPETANPSIRTAIGKQKFRFSNFIEMKAVPVCISAMLFAFSYSSIISFMAVYTSELGIPAAAMYYFITFAISIMVTRPIIGKLLDSKGPSYLIIPSLIIFALGLMIMGSATSMLQILVSGVILGVAYGAIFPSFQTITIKLSPVDKAGSATATFFLFYDSGFGLGAFALAVVASYFGYANMYLIVSGLILLTLVLYYLLYHRKQQSSIAN
ncbi:MFS transporter [Sphingobacterium mizutaii]|uniref:MFS transporter n=1 Tax=Sphingobacterium mizutaii TaxID=1010 RepID=UPI0028ABFA07|nr:MFS transporter [Sphingobacterium mizutaii]